MPSTHTSLYFHIVFSTKQRESWFPPPFRSRLHAYLGGVIRGLDGVPHAVGGVQDHVHILAGLKPVHRLSDVMREIKSDSSRWIKDELGRSAFAWQEGYGAFTFGAPDLENVRRYVLNQEEHHRTRTFQEEYLDLLRRGLVEYHEEHLW
jgi:REP element-mobilizing transposase RayT